MSKVKLADNNGAGNSGINKK